MTKLILALAFFVGFCATYTSAQNLTLWECNRCHQQYQGNNPPAFVKCPATNNTQNHWWIRKR